jgi:hypothetical protein
MRTNGQVKRGGRIVALVVVPSAIFLIAAHTAHPLEVGGAGGPSAVASGTQRVVQSVQLDNDLASFNARDDCRANPATVSAVGALIVVVPTIPAVLEVNLTPNTRFASQPITGLSAVIALRAADQTIGFDGVTPGTPLLPDRSASRLSMLSGLPALLEGGVCGMTIEGQLQDGQPFSHAVQIALVNG